MTLRNKTQTTSPEPLVTTIQNSQKSISTTRISRLAKVNRENRSNEKSTFLNKKGCPVFDTRLDTTIKETL